MLITLKSTDAYARREAGGKGYNLYLMTRAGLPVPPWVVLSASLFRRFLDGAGLTQPVAALLGETQDVAAASERIIALIEDAALAPDIVDEILAARQSLGTATIAVRSSALDEDGARHSFAGQMSSFLHVATADETVARVRSCWASAYSVRNLTYRLENGLGSDAGVAVVLQEMVSPDSSGVMFTCDPVSADPSRIVVNAVYGLGEGLVSGALEADQFVLNKETGEVVDSQLVQKRTRFVAGEDGGIREVPVPTDFSDQPSITSDVLSDLADLGRRVEAFYRYPQDIEWATKAGRLTLLQARPVTTQVQATDPPLQIWDNSNIVESYGGITLPLTFSFARFVYHQVYEQFCQILLVPPCQIRKMDRILRNMLGSFNGRVYYNLLNWYRLTSILPLFKYNRGFMETMMGTGVSLDDVLADTLGRVGVANRLLAGFRRFRTGLKFLYYHFTIQKRVDGFLEHFHQVYDRFRYQDYRRRPAQEIVDAFHALESELLRQWQAPIVNDYLCMVHFGLLRRLAESWVGEAGVENDLLCGAGSLESAEPTRELMRLAGLVVADPALGHLLEETPDSDCHEALAQSDHAEFREEIALYLDRYGFRCASEMKLEQADLKQDPTFLFVCLKNLIRSGQTDPFQMGARESQIRREAEDRVRKTLSLPRRIVFSWALRHARKAVRNRESTRFCRTRVYGVVRSMFRGVGEDFARRGVIESAEDVFYLTMDEMHGALEAWLTVQDLTKVVALRKAEYAGYADRECEPRFVTRGPAYWMNEMERNEDEEEMCNEAGALKGTGACPGIVEGPVMVVHSPEEVGDLTGHILVAVRTDPGWIPLFPSASGLLVERGGLLSHSAIVAREMGLPTVVGLRGLTRTLETGMRVRMNGQTGQVEIVEEDEDDDGREGTLVPGRVAVAG